MSDPTPQPQPVLNWATVASALSGLVVAIGAFIVYFGWATDQQISDVAAMTLRVVLALGVVVGIAGPLWAAHHAAKAVTPLSSPRNDAGEPLKTAAEWADQYGRHSSPDITPRRKLGRLPNQGRPRVKLTADLLPATVPAAPESVDWYTKVPPTSWGMDGNGPDPGNPPQAPDGAGDCAFAEVDHSTKARQVAAGNPEVNSTTPEVLGAYSSLTGYDPRRPATDQGAEMQAVRDFWRKNGVTLGGKLDKITLFAQVDHTDLNLVKLAVQHFGAVGLGINFPASAMQQFDAGKPWTVVKGARIEGGHAVSMIGYDAAYAYVVTWGRVQPMDWAFFGHYVEEAWTDVSADWIGPNGEDPLGEVAFALGVQFQALTGQPNPFPGPAPAPAPGPAPAVPADWVTWARHTLTLKGQSHATVTVAGEIVAAAGQP